MSASGKRCSTTIFWQSKIQCPNATRSLTQWGALNRERESSGEGGGQARGCRRSRVPGRKLSQWGESPQVVAGLAENDERRERQLSASCVNRLVGEDSANRKSSPEATQFVTILCLYHMFETTQPAFASRLAGFRDSHGGSPTDATGFELWIIWFTAGQVPLRAGSAGARIDEFCGSRRRRRTCLAKHAQETVAALGSRGRSG